MTDSKVDLQLQSVTLSNGVVCPSIGFGCAFGNWSDKSKIFGFQPDLAWQAVHSALKVGYKHLDCAYAYGTHKIVGLTLGTQMVKGAKREDFFITTKVFHMPADIASNSIGKTLDMTNPSINIKERVLYDFEKSLDELNLGFVDLLLMHWPGQGTDEKLNRRLRKECWEVFQDIYKSGKARAIGVSNFTVKHLTTFLQDINIAPMVNQIEVSPYIHQKDVVEYCRQKGIVVTAWAPFGSGATGVLEDPVISTIAKTHNKNPGQVILRWLLQQGMMVLPKSSNEARMASNLDVWDFSLSVTEMASMTALDQNKSSVVTADGIA